VLSLTSQSAAAIHTGGSFIKSLAGKHAPLSALRSANSVLFSTLDRAPRLVFEEDTTTTHFTTDHLHIKP
jgi:hypothetical protein